MAKLFAKEDLPHLRSTRDTRDRLDLITASVSVDATKLRADRIKYHPGDTAAAHYHSDCHHIFHVLGGTGILHVDAESLRLSAGMTVIVNGQQHELADGAMLTDVVARLTASVRGVAVALNGSVVPRREWASTTLADTDQIEVLTAVQGG
jgi:sulfur carrier protein